MRHTWWVLLVLVVGCGEVRIMELPDGGVGLEYDARVEIDAAWRVEIDTDGDSDSDSDSDTESWTETDTGSDTGSETEPCSGCVDAEGVCQPGDSVEACGIDGNDCVVCPESWCVGATWLYDVVCSDYQGVCGGASSTFCSSGYCDDETGCLP